MSRLATTLKVVFSPLIFVLWLFGFNKYVGEDSFVEYWGEFDKR